MSDKSLPVTDVPGAIETKQAHDEAVAVLNNICDAAGMSKEDPLYQSLIGVMLASRTGASVDGAVANLVNVYQSKRDEHTPG